MKATGAHVFATARNLDKGKKALSDSECSSTIPIIIHVLTYYLS